MNYCLGITSRGVKFPQYLGCSVALEAVCCRYLSRAHHCSNILWQVMGKWRSYCSNFWETHLFGLYWMTSIKQLLSVQCTLFLTLYVPSSVQKWLCHTKVQNLPVLLIFLYLYSWSCAWLQVYLWQETAFGQTLVGIFGRYFLGSMPLKFGMPSLQHCESAITTIWTTIFTVLPLASWCPS